MIFKLNIEILYYVLMKILFYSKLPINLILVHFRRSISWSDYFFATHIDFLYRLAHPKFELVNI